MTLLEYVCEKLLGPAVSSDGNGQSTWPCPRHDDPGASFHTLPHQPGKYKDRFRCWHCSFWGDEADILREVFPQDNPGQRRARLAALKIDYGREQPEHGAESPSFISPGMGSTNVEPTRVYDADPRQDEFSEAADAAFAELLEYLGNLPNDEALFTISQVSARVLEICAEHKLHPLGLAGRIRAEVWIREMEQEHLEQCNDDPDCDHQCCRLARGWTQEEILEDLAAQRAAKAKRMERIRKSVRRSVRQAVKRNGKGN